jgi:thioredoxin 1
MPEEQKVSRSIFEDAPGPEQSSKTDTMTCSCRSWWKVAVVAVLAAAVAGIMASKTRQAPSLQEGLAPTAQREPEGAANPPPAETKVLATGVAGRGQKPPVADNPLDHALATGRPVVADFGRGMCVPCKMMKPILDELGGQYKSRAEVLIIEIDDYPDVTRRVGIRAIPTQIFYDSDGNEVYRHEGFMPREDIVAKLAEMGVP